MRAHSPDVVAGAGLGCSGKQVSHMGHGGTAIGPSPEPPGVCICQEAGVRSQSRALRWGTGHLHQEAKLLPAPVLCPANLVRSYLNIAECWNLVSEQGHRSCAPYRHSFIHYVTHASSHPAIHSFSCGVFLHLQCGASPAGVLRCTQQEDRDGSLPFGI